MTTPLQEYRKSTYDRTIERLRQEQEQKKTWLDEKLVSNSQLECARTKK